MDKKYFYIFGIIGTIPILLWGFISFAFSGMLAGVIFLLAPLFSITALFYIKNRVDTAGVLFIVSSICGLVTVGVEADGPINLFNAMIVNNIDPLLLILVETLLLLFSLGITAFSPRVGKILISLVFVLTIISINPIYSFTESPIIGIIFVISALLLLITKGIPFFKRIKK